MSPTIEKAEVVSFSLKIPLESLEGIQEELQPLSVKMEATHSDEIQISAGDCSLRFRPVEDIAELVFVQIVNDERGLFFQRVLGPLMVRFHGDLHLKLRWNVENRNTHGTHADVRIAQGVTTYPGLGIAKNIASLSAEAAALFERSEPEAAPPSALTAQEEAEIARLLEEGRRHFEEYLRLKGKAQSQTA